MSKLPIMTMIHTVQAPANAKTSPTVCAKNDFFMFVFLLTILSKYFTRSFSVSV